MKFHANRTLVCVLLLLSHISEQGRVHGSSDNDEDDRRRRRQQEQTQGKQKHDAGTADDNDQTQGQFRRKPAFLNNQLETAMYSMYADIFAPSRQPRHLLRGAMQGMQTFAVGGLVGSALFTVLPVALAMQNGATGFAIGLVPGSVLGIAATILGASMGLYQFIVSLCNTPTTVLATLKGMTWDTDTDRWHYYSMENETQQILNGGGDGNGNGDYMPVDTTLYDLLQVSPHASTTELKQSYKRMAKLYHPDKNSDPTAKDIFLSIHEAYDVLSDDQRRTQYDQDGRSRSHGGTAIPNLNPALAVLVGAHNMMDYTGDLYLATLAKRLIDSYNAVENNPDDPTFDFSFKAMRRGQKKRELNIARTLLHKIKDYGADISRDAFQIKIAQQATTMSKSNVAGRMLSAVGYALQHEASSYQQIDMGFTGSVIKKMYRYKHKLDLVKELWKVKQSFGTIKQAAEEALVSSDLPEDVDIKQCLATLMELLVTITILDISITLEGACWRLFRDSDVSNKERRRRAEAIGMIGAEFQAVGDAWSDKSDAAMTEEHVLARFETAFELLHPHDDIKSSYRNAEDTIQKRARKHKAATNAS